MRTLFLNPPSFSRFDSAGARFAATRKTRSLWYPAWLGYAAAFVPNSKLFDCPASGIGLEELLITIKRFDLVVIYTSTPSFINNVKVAQKIKENNPETKIIFVGPRVSVLPEETLRFSEVIDAVARREFEETILEISQDKNWSKIKGLSFRKKGEIINNPDRPFPLDLDKIPFVSKIYKRDLPINSYHLPFCLHPYISIYAGRGCPNLCTFCLWPQTFTGRIYRKRSVENVIGEMEWIKKNMPEVKEIFFDDDTFTVNKSWVKEFCHQVKPLNITWSVNARADLSLDNLKLMKDAGCRVMVVGFESGDEKILKNIKKNETVKQMREFCKNAKTAGLMIHGTFMLGLPGETRKTIEKTFKFALELDPETIQVTIATPLPGTEFFAYCRNNGFLKTSPLVTSQGYQSPTVSYSNLSDEEIKKAVEKLHLKFYLRPSYLLKSTKKVLSSSIERKRIISSGWEYGKYLLTHVHEAF
ncbi:MAG: hopanoid biosynthesis associated radical SAM protein HpnJ [bacterium]|nr:hopanoid biosynthesis associated radical SAM protein HpnJ [bacterium]